jgi:hypothetical protein
MLARHLKSAPDNFHQGISMKQTAATVIFAFAMSLLMSACVYRAEPGQGHGRGQKGDFCPPGQAKKGNC